MILQLIKFVSRRDSFITHRAFCDALAEETARFTAAAASHMNNHPSNINYHFINGSSSPGLIQHFPPINHHQNIDPTPTGRGLSLWMAQDSIAKNLQEMHQIGNFPHDQLMNNPTSSYNHQLNWDFGNKLGNEDLISTNNTIPIAISNVKEVSVPSLFSHHHDQPSSATISATALLQKAAQIGATTSDSSMLGSFGIKGSDSIFVHHQDGNKLCGLYSTTTNSATSGLGSDVELSVNNLNHLEMFPPSKRRRLSNEEITRDFLGVGIQSICHPSSINGGWV